MTRYSDHYDDEPDDRGKRAWDSANDWESGSSWDEADEVSSDADLLAGEAAALDDDLVPCSHCRELVYDDSECCPHCGEYLTASRDRFAEKPLWYVVLVMAGVLAVIAVLILLPIFY